MKKKRGLEGACLPPERNIQHSILRQAIMVIKVCYVLLCITCLQLQARTYSQTITLNTKQTSLEQIFQAVEQQTGYVVLYNYRELQRAKPVTIAAKNQEIATFLDHLFANQPFTYNIEDKTILVSKIERITPKKVTSIAPIPQQQSELTGSIKDAAGSPLEGLTVSIQGTNIAAKTDAAGRYRI